MKNVLHILLACMVSLAPPGASMIRYSCDLTGATTQIISALGAGNHADECCSGEAATQSLASASNDCCHVTVFALRQTSPTPTQPVAHVTPVFASFDLLPSDVAVRLAVVHESRPISGSFGRNLPLLV